MTQRFILYVLSCRYQNRRVKSILVNIDTGKSISDRVRNLAPSFSFLGEEGSSMFYETLQYLFSGSHSEPLEFFIYITIYDYVLTIKSSCSQLGSSG